jgi:hypothetical protein
MPSYASRSQLVVLFCIGLLSPVDAEQGARAVKGDIPAKRAWRSEDGRARARDQEAGAVRPIDLLVDPV